MLCRHTVIAGPVIFSAEVVTYQPMIRSRTRIVRCPEETDDTHLLNPMLRPIPQTATIMPTRTTPHSIVTISSLFFNCISLAGRISAVRIKKAIFYYTMRGDGTDRIIIILHYRNEQQRSASCRTPGRDGSGRTLSASTLLKAGTGCGKLVIFSVETFHSFQITAIFIGGQ